MAGDRRVTRGWEAYTVSIAKGCPPTKRTLCKRKKLDLEYLKRKLKKEGRLIKLIKCCSLVDKVRVPLATHDDLQPVVLLVLPLHQAAQQVPSRYGVEVERVRQPGGQSQFWLLLVWSASWFASTCIAPGRGLSWREAGSGSGRPRWGPRRRWWELRREGESPPGIALQCNWQPGRGPAPGSASSAPNSCELTYNPRLATKQPVWRRGLGRPAGW